MIQMIPMQSDCVSSNRHNIFDEYAKIAKNRKPFERSPKIIFDNHIDNIDDS